MGRRLHPAVARFARERAAADYRADRAAVARRRLDDERSRTVHVLEAAARRYCSLCGVPPDEPSLVTRYEVECLARAAPGLAYPVGPGRHEFQQLVPRWAREASQLLRERALRAALAELDPPRPRAEAVLPPEDAT